MSAAIWTEVSRDVRVRMGASPEFPAEDLRVVDEIWAGEVRRRPGELFDGRLLCLVDAGWDELRAASIPYRVHLAQSRSPRLRERLGVESLAVTGLVQVEGQVLVGRRSQRVTHHCGRLELVPAGTLEAPQDGGEVDFRGHLLEELQEETGIPSEEVAAVEALGLLADPSVLSRDIVCQIRLRCGLAEARRHLAACGDWEHDELDFHPIGWLREVLASRPEEVVPGVDRVLDAMETRASR